MMRGGRAFCGAVEVKPREDRDSGEILADTASVQRVLTETVSEALWRHKRLGEPICVWRDGRVVRIAPEDIPER